MLCKCVFTLQSHHFQLDSSFRQRNPSLYVLQTWIDPILVLQYFFVVANLAPTMSANSLHKNLLRSAKTNLLLNWISRNKICADCIHFIIHSFQISIAPACNSYFAYNTIWKLILRGIRLSVRSLARSPAHSCRFIHWFERLDEKLIEANLIQLISIDLYTSDSSPMALDCVRPRAFVCVWAMDGCANICLIERKGEVKRRRQTKNFVISIGLFKNKQTNENKCKKLCEAMCIRKWTVTTA